MIKEDYLEAKKQLLSLHHKVSKSLETLQSKEDLQRHASQITLAKRRLKAFELSIELIDKELERG